MFQYTPYVQIYTLGLFPNPFPKDSVQNRAKTSLKHHIRVTCKGRVRILLDRDGVKIVDPDVTLYLNRENGASCSIRVSIDIEIIS